MSPQFITVEGIRLAYLEKNPGIEKIIFFVHGNSSSSNTWRAQFGSELLSGYRLIAFDLPAHGQSELSPDYSLPALGRIMAQAVMSLAGNCSFIICGVSLGANIVAEMLGHDLEAMGAVAIGSCAMGGEHTMEVVFQPGVDMRPSLEDDVPAEALRQYWTQSALCCHDEGSEKYCLFEKDYYKVKDHFRSKMAATVMAGRIGDEVALLRQSAKPMLVLFGGEEKVCNIAYLDHAGLRLWQNKTFIIPGAGHFVHIDLPGSTNQLLAAFAKDVLGSK
ncbi:MAG TPA: alpha/beta hydrolase [Puia sp.]|nr:alpha/beta hydrolase [Puia sp.]